MNNYQQNIIEKYIATNRIAFYHPRKKTISLNGGRELPINEAITQMMDCLMNADKTHEPKEADNQMKWDFLKQKRHYNS